MGRRGRQHDVDRDLEPYKTAAQWLLRNDVEFDVDPHRRLIWIKQEGHLGRTFRRMTMNEAVAEYRRGTGNDVDSGMGGN